MNLLLHIAYLHTVGIDAVTTAREERSDNDKSLLGNHPGTTLVGRGGRVEVQPTAAVGC